MNIIRRVRISVFALVCGVVFLLGIPLIAYADVVISEIFYDPLGTDTGWEWIEIWNKENSDFDLTGYDLNATSGDYYTFPSFILGGGKCVVVHWRTLGIDSLEDLYTGVLGFDVNMGNTKGWVALFSGATHNSSTIVDYVEYGSGGMSWESAAISAGIWTIGNYAPVVPTGHSLEYDGSGDSGGDWHNQPNPNPGVPVPEPCSIFLLGSGLLGLVGFRFRKRRS